MTMKTILVAMALVPLPASAFAAQQEGIGGKTAAALLSWHFPWVRAW